MPICLPSFVGVAQPASSGGTPFVGNQYSVSFDGSDGRMNVGTGVNLTGSATVSLWFRRTGSVSGYGGALIATDNIYTDNFDNTFAISLKNGTDLTLESYNWKDGTYTNPVAAGVVSLNTWYHLALVLTYTDSSTSSAQFYIDGSTVGSAITLSGRTLAGLNEGFEIASYFVNNSYSYFFPGQVDELSIFNSALSASQITNIYKGEESGGSEGADGVPGDLSTFSPVGWWRMGDGSDGSGNNDGTVVGGLPQIYNVATDGSGNRITGIDGSLTNISSPNGIVSDVPS